MNTFYIVDRGTKCDKCDKKATVVFRDISYYCSKHALEYLKEYRRTGKGMSLNQRPDWEFTNG